jgi:hypothetical protein
LPTLIWRVFLRGASTGGGAAGMPRSIEVTGFLSSSGEGRSGSVEVRRQPSCTGTTMSA